MTEEQIEKIVANCVANQAIEGMICTEEDKAAIRRIISGQTTAEEEVAALIAEKIIRCFYDWDGVCKRDGGAAVPIEEGQCAACPNFCVESWRADRYFEVREEISKEVIEEQADEEAWEQIMDFINANVAEKDEVELTPSFHGEQCQGNGKHPGIECQCDNCDHYLTCYPDWREYH